MNIINCNNLSQLSKLIIKEFNYGGSSQSLFYLCSIKSIYFLLKISFYYKSFYELNNEEKTDEYINSVDVEIEILKLLKEFLDDKKTPCIIDIIYHKICDITNYKYTKIENLENIEKNITRCLQLTEKKLSFPKCAFIILERCDMTLTTYLRKIIFNEINLEIFKSIIFHIIYALYQITKKYKTFKHNDLHSSNIMIKLNNYYSFNFTKMKFINYENKYYVPYFGLIPKIIDFGHASITEKNIMSSNEKTPEKQALSIDNDMYLLLHTVYQVYIKENNINANKLYEFLDLLDPTKMYINFDNYEINKYEKNNKSNHLEYKRMLKVFNYKKSGKVYEKYN